MELVLPRFDLALRKIQLNFNRIYTVAQYNTTVIK